jgi:hypothetical protein
LNAWDLGEAELKQARDLWHESEGAECRNVSGRITDGSPYRPDSSIGDLTYPNPDELHWLSLTVDTHS